MLIPSSHEWSANDEMQLVTLVRTCVAVDKYSSLDASR